MNKVIISIGSNYNRTSNINDVIGRLKEQFPNSRYSTPQVTEPIGMDRYTKTFINLVGLIQTDQSSMQLTALFKKIEKELGRSKDNDSEGIIPMDIDIIEWNDEIFKPKDLMRPYIVAGMDELDEF